MQTLDQINQDIDGTLKDSPTRNITPGGLRNLLKKVTQYVTDVTLNKVSPWLNSANDQPSLSVTDIIYRTAKTLFGRKTDDGTGAVLQATTASIPNINGGVSLNRSFAIGPSGPATYRYFKILTLPASSPGTRDMVHVRAMLGTYGSQYRTIVDAVFGNRDGFSFAYKLEGGVTQCGLACFNNAGTVTLYAKVLNEFRTGVINVMLNVQATVYDNLTEELPVGALIFDSQDPATYPPFSNNDGTTLVLSGMLRTGNGNKAFKVTSLKPASGLSLNTGRYLELQLEDGTIVKVAEVN